MHEYRTILKRVGTAWVIFGLFDIALMIFFIIRMRGYSSSFNIFAIIIGAFLIRGSLRVTTFVTHFTAFMLTFYTGAILIFLMRQPIGLLIAQVKYNPLVSLISLSMFIATIILLGWTFNRMRSEPVLDARKASGRSTKVPKVAIGIGIVLTTFLAIMLNTILNGTVGTKAETLARVKLGPDYQYATQSIRVSGKHHHATVAAYNDKALKVVRVNWIE